MYFHSPVFTELDNWTLPYSNIYSAQNVTEIMYFAQMF